MAMAQQTDMDELNLLTNLMQKITLSSYRVGTWHCIKVTHINNPSSFYVRPVEYDNYLSSLQALGSKIEAKDVCIGNIVVCFSEKSKCHIRGHIIFINKEDQDIKIDLFAMDYGHVEKDIPLCKIFKPLHIIQVPPLAQHCQLELCKPREGTWQQRSIDAMIFYVGNEKTHILVRNKNDDVLTVEMHNSCPKDISTMLALMGYSNFGYDPRTSISRFSATPAPVQAFYNTQKLKLDDSLHVRTQSWKSLEEFYVADMNEYKKYIEERNNIACFARQEDPIKPKEISQGTPACVPTSKRFNYERALIREVNKSESTALVQLVDWGDIIEVPFDQIKPIRESFLERPPIAIFCCIDPDLIDPRLKKILYPGYPFVIKIKSVGVEFDTPYIVNIFEMPQATKKIAKQTTVAKSYAN